MFPVANIAAPIKRDRKSLKGVFGDYANLSKRVQEDDAWQRHIFGKV